MPSRRRRARYVGEGGTHVGPKKLPSLCHLGQLIIGTKPLSRELEPRLILPELAHWKRRWLHTGIPWRYCEFHSRLSP